MPEVAALEALVRARVPVLAVESAEELRVPDLYRRLALRTAMPVFQWSITEGLKRLDLDFEAQCHARQPEELLRHIKASTGVSGVYVLIDFHPDLEEPLHVRLLKEIAPLSTRFRLQLPDEQAIVRIVREEAAL